ncbi:MAG: deoxyribonuclease IV [Candidatus Ureaplasma intestinipullorum]|uniref:Probable endonuclease 4 n=1 Tax=Candidatus Ureaplasma intestinipullorum TaxID=2838770 RepID=A0A9E2NW00_9BACT|nr:deoxyribonuclease IV [Candidatus Ureaplasma intestinipullorum]
MNKKLLIGSHVSLTAPDYYLGSVNEAISYNANTFMIYTGAPQNTIRKSTDMFKINDAILKIKEHNMELSKIVVHAPYIINLCSDKNETRLLGINFLIEEIKRCEKLGLNLIVLHPGCALSNPVNHALELVYEGLNYVFDNYPTDIIICIETMAGKGTEVGKTFEEIKTIIDNIKSKKNIGVCFDTCHLNDAGYDLSNFDLILDEFDQKIGLNYLKVIHINDSKNPINSHKDRHENIGHGYIGFDILNKVVHNDRIADIPKILETPYINIGEKKSIPPYKEEIEMFVNQKWFNIKN